MSWHPFFLSMRSLCSWAISNTKFHLWMDHTRWELITNPWLQILCIWIIDLWWWNIILEEWVAHDLLFMIIGIYLLPFLTGLAVLKLCWTLTLWFNISTLKNVKLNILFNSFTFFNSICFVNLTSLFFNPCFLVINIDVYNIVFVELFGPSLRNTILYFIFELFSIGALC